MGDSIHPLGYVAMILIISGVAVLRKMPRSIFGKVNTNWRCTSWHWPIRPMSRNGQADAAVPSELNVLLDLYSDEEDRNAIHKAHHDSAHGDPKTFPVQFAVLLTDLAHALKVYQRPDPDIRKAQVDVRKFSRL